MSVRRISKNIAALTTAELISKALQLVLFVYAARLLGKADFGKFSFALAFSMIAIIFTDLGINTLLVREIARKKDLASKYFTNAFLAKFVFSALTFITAIFILNILDLPPITKNVVYIILLFTLISSFTELLYSIFRAFERMEFDALVKVTRMVILTSVGLYVLFKGYGVITFSFIFILAELIVFILALNIGVIKFIKLKISFDMGFIRELVKKSFPFGLAIAFGSIYFYIGSVMLSVMKNDVEVAIYSVAYNLVIALLVIPTIYTNAIYPVLSRHFKSSKENLIFMYKKSFKYMYIIGLPISVGLFLLADKIILLFYTKEYFASIFALKILAWFVFIKFLNFLIGIVLYSIDRQKHRMLSQGSTALFNIILNLILIPFLGFIGAAIATLITEIFLFVFYYGFASKYLHALNLTPILTRPLIAAGIMATFLYYVKLNLLFLVPSAAIVYVFSILILRVFDKEDKNLILKIVKND